MNNILIIFGATGDLMDKKISPALFGLNKEKSQIIDKVYGFGRRDLVNDEFKSMVRESISKKLKFSEDEINEFLNKVEYHKGEFHDIDSYKSLDEKILKEFPNVIKHIYLAIPPELYSLVINSLNDSNLIDSNTKLMVEKPIGHDLNSSIETEDLFSKFFREDQIYRIDHYLGKDSVQNILSFRFANSMFDPIWNNKHVEKIEVIMHETLGVENRGNFYDNVGALRDFGQNHLLQLLALTTMDEPGELCCENIRESRANLLKSIKVLNEDEIVLNTYRSQYQGYREINGVDQSSQTETYFKVKTQINSERWKGVPIYLETGKRMNSLTKEIIIHIKDVNKVIFTLEPEDSIKISVKTKKPGISYENEDNMIILNMNRNDTMQYVAEYTQLLHDFLTGDQTFFISKAESEYMWRFTQPILDAWNKDLIPLENYVPDTNEAYEKANSKLSD